jgi:carbon storage regulator CsrA
MLILDIEQGSEDGIRIGDDIRITVSEASGRDTTKLHIDAPRNIQINRIEVNDLKTVQ